MKKIVITILIVLLLQGCAGLKSDCPCNEIPDLSRRALIESGVINHLDLHPYEIMIYDNVVYYVEPSHIVWYNSPDGPMRTVKVFSRFGDKVYQLIDKNDKWVIKE